MAPPEASCARLPPGGTATSGRPVGRRPFVAALVVGLAGLASFALSSCGFQLRGSANYSFDSIYIGAPPTLPFTVELKRALAGAGSAKVLDAPLGAQVILDVLGISDDKAVLSLSPGGRAREFLLTKRVVFLLRSADGAIWLPQDEIVIRRTYLYDDTERLAREIQEQRLLAEMQSDAISQIVRRLQSAKKP